MQTHDLIEVSISRGGQPQLHLTGTDPEVVAATIRAYAESLSPTPRKSQVMRG